MLMRTLLKSTLLAFENWVSRRNGVGARVSAPSTGFTRSDDSVAYLIGLQAKRRGCRRRPCSARRRGGSSIVRVRTVGPTASQPCLDCSNQDEQDGESETEAYGGGLGNLVRLEFR